MNTFLDQCDFFNKYNLTQYFDNNNHICLLTRYKEINKTETTKRSYIVS